VIFDILWIARIIKEDPKEKEKKKREKKIEKKKEKRKKKSNPRDSTFARAKNTR